MWELKGNVLSRSAYRRGDVDAALAASAHTVHEMFQTQRVEHAFLEPESTLAVPQQDGKLKVFSGGQGVWDDRKQIASVLGIPVEQVVVEQVSNGGAFGGKEDMSNQAQTALASWLLAPAGQVHAVARGVVPRPPQAPSHPAGVLGRLRRPGPADRPEGPHDRGLRPLRVGRHEGARARRGARLGPVPRAHRSTWSRLAVRTNNPVCGAFRGFGANQAQFAMEGVMDRLAEKVGISGWEMRARNVVHPGEVWGPVRSWTTAAGARRACLEAVKPAYDEAVAAGKAVGLGLGLKNSGLGNGFLEIVKAVVRFSEDGDVEVRHCWTEMGQGIHTVARQVVVEELGVAAERVHVVVDTTRELDAGQTTGSRGTLMGAGAVADACRHALADGCRPGVDYMGEYRVDWTNSIEDGDRAPDDPLRLLVRRAAGRDRP